MSVLAVAGKDVRESLRTYTLVGLTAAFVFVAGGLAAIHWVPVPFRESDVSSDTLALLNSMRQATVLFVPMIGLALGTRSVSGERDRGTIRLLLGLPITRRAVVLGKFLGRTTVVGIASFVGFAVAGAIALATYDSFDVVVFGGYSTMTFLYGAVFVAIGIGFSAGMPSRVRAIAGGAALYTLFLLGWDLFMVLLVGLTGRNALHDPVPEWIQFVGLWNPANAFTHATRAVLPEYGEVTTYPTADAAYLQDWIGFVVLACWIAVPLCVGYLRFRTVDL